MGKLTMEVERWVSFAKHLSCLPREGLEDFGSFLPKLETSFLRQRQANLGREVLN